MMYRPQPQQLPAQSRESSPGTIRPASELERAQFEAERGRIGLGKRSVVIQGNGLVFFYDRDNSQSQRLRHIVSGLKKDYANVLTVFIVDRTWNPEVADTFDIDEFPSLVLFKNGKTISQINGEFTADDVHDLVKQNFADITDQPPDRRTLTYNGRTFDEWRDLWKTELGSVTRLEAVIALAAFGRAGYGKEAAQAILDIAAQYDFMMIGDDDIGKLQEAILNELAPDARSQHLAKYWIPDLAARLEKDPKQWMWLAYHLLERLRRDDELGLEFLESLAESGPAELRTKALSALVRSQPVQSSGEPRLDEKTRALLLAALKSDDPIEVRSVLPLLVYPHRGKGIAQLMFYPELLPLVFHTDEAVQQAVRHVLRDITEADAPKVVKEFLAVLNDESRQADHVAAIRALGAMGRHAEPAALKLEKLLKESAGDERLLVRVAAGFALDRIEGGQRGGNYLLESLNNTLNEPARTRFQRLINEEHQIQQP
jgi:thioredoxin-like negative regulator of GroEL